jgi:hypothetical protein
MQAKNGCFWRFKVIILVFPNVLILYPFPEPAKSTSSDNVRACFPAISGEVPRHSFLVSPLLAVITRY